MIGAVIIGHDQFAEALVNATFSIVGEQKKVVAISNRVRSMHDLTDLIQSKVSEMGEAVVFTDLPGGSCTIACKSLGVPIITGVNLPMLLEFMLIREKHSIDELAEIMEKTGRKGIRRI